MSTVTPIRVSAALILALASGVIVQAAVVKPKPKPTPAKVTTRPGAKAQVRPRAAVRRGRKPVKPINPLALLPPMPASLMLRLPLDIPPPPVAGTCESCGVPLVATAYSLVGIRYRRGGGSPEYGFDCSGLTRYIYQTNFDVTLPTSAPGQFQTGVALARSELRPGDLVFFRHRWRGWHVGIYIGGDSFIHAPNPRRKVSVSSLNDPYWRTTYVGARRIPLSDAPVMTNALTVSTN